MLTCALFFNLIGVWSHYTTSKKTKINKVKLEKWLENHKNVAILLAIMLQFISFFILLYNYSWVTAFFVLLSFWMLSTSLIILGRPLKTPSAYYVLLILVLGILIENNL